MVRGSAERHRQVAERKAGVDDVEERGVLDSEEARQPIVIGIVDDEPGLQAGDVRRGAREGRDREPQLVAIGHVLGVVDRHELAARERERDVERAGLCAGLARRRHDDLDESGKRGVGERVGHLAIVGLDHELHVLLGLGVIERRHGGDQPGKHPALAAKRHDDRVDRQRVVGWLRDAARRPRRYVLADRPEPHGHYPEEDEAGHDHEGR
jgi:hypothetical protein